MLRFQYIIVIFLCLTILSVKAFAVCSCECELGWIGLYNMDMLEWLENQNKINMEKICPKSMYAKERNTCIQQHLNPMRKRIDVRKAPTYQSEILGQIEIVATPAKGLSAVWVTPISSSPFMTDMFDEDWGYGPYFHMTVMGRHGSWFLLPRNPFPDKAWIDTNQFTQAADFKVINIGEVYLFRGESIVITSIQKKTFTIRKEQPADMWCDSGEPPKMTSSHYRTLRISELFNKDCHLILKVKYTRGC